MSIDSSVIRAAPSYQRAGNCTGAGPGYAGRRTPGNRRLRQYVVTDRPVRAATSLGEGVAAAFSLDGTRTWFFCKLRSFAARRVSASEIILAVVTLQRAA